MENTLDQLAAAVHTNLTDLNIFSVTTIAAKQEVWVDFNLADTQFWVILTQRSVKTLFRVVIKLYPDGKTSVRDEWYQLEWSAGIPQLGARMQTSFSKGTQYNFVKTAEYKFTGNGLEEAYAYAINTGTVLGRVKSIVKTAGYKLKMDGATKIGVAVGGATLVLLAIFGILAAAGVVKLNSAPSTPTNSQYYNTS